ncbi:MAG: transcription initiation protein [Gemmatimonadetes bacterium]|nr:transcription initiation protein [Gemmatimonadota bacterium]
MPKYILELHEPPVGKGTDISPEEMQQMIAEYTEWSRKMGQAEIVVDGWKLTNEGGKHLVAKGGKVAVTDGPYSEAKEILAGLFLIQARDYDHAAEVAQSCPHMKFGRIVIRQVDMMEE